MARISEANIDYINLQDRSTDSDVVPNTDFAHLYIKNNALFIRLDSGTAIEIGTSSVSGLDDLSDVDLSSPVPATGSILAYNGANFIPLSVGTNGQSLVADSGEPTGLAWTSTVSGVDDDARIFALLGW